MKGAKAQLIKTRDQELANCETLKQSAVINEKARIFLLSEITERRQQAVQSIEELATNILQLVYGDTISLKFETFDEKRKAEGKNDFKMAITIGDEYEGKQYYKPLIGNWGGGVVEMVGYALRWAGLRCSGYDGPIFLDETFKNLSNDDKIEQIARVQRKLTRQSGRQVIFATHKTAVFGPIADNIIQIEKHNGVAKIIKVELSTLPEGFETGETDWG
jgi:hypothetical protein